MIIDQYLQNLDEDKNIDFNHIEYIEIIDDYIYFLNEYNMMYNYIGNRLYVGDVISIQYLSAYQIVIKLNDVIIDAEEIGLTKCNFSITWHQLYWHTYTHMINYLKIITKEIIRDKKLKKLLCII